MLTLREQMGVKDLILPVLCLETRVQTCQEWMVCCQGKDSLFCHCALHIIVLYDDIFFQHLDNHIGMGWIIVTL